MISKVSNFYNSIFVVFTSQIIFNSDLFQNLISKVPIFVIYLFIYLFIFIPNFQIIIQNLHFLSKLISKSSHFHI